MDQHQFIAKEGIDQTKKAGGHESVGEQVAQIVLDPLARLLALFLAIFSGDLALNIPLLLFEHGNRKPVNFNECFLENIETAIKLALDGTQSVINFLLNARTIFWCEGAQFTQTLNQKPRRVLPVLKKRSIGQRELCKW